MHEMAIATELLQQVLDVAAEHGAVSVDEITVRCGVLRQVVPEALETAFSVASRETPAEGATLKIEQEPAEALCRVCGRPFDCRVDEFLCPNCKHADVDIVRGNQILLVSLVCRTPDGASAR